MNPSNVVKRVPKWAWIASGGIVVGSIGLRYLRGNSAAAPDGESKQTDASAGSAVDPYGVGTTSGGSVVVPSITVQAPEQDTGFALALLDPLLGAFASTQQVLLALPGEVLAGVQTGAGIFGAGVELGGATYASGAELGTTVTMAAQQAAVEQQQSVLQTVLGTVIPAAASTSSTPATVTVVTGGGSPTSDAPAGAVSVPPPASPNPAPLQIPAPTAPTPPTRICGSGGDTGLYPYTNPVNGKCYRHYDEYKWNPDTKKCTHYYWNLYFDGTKVARQAPTTASNGACGK